ALRGHRARPIHHAQARAHDGRRRDGGERARQGLDLHRAAAGRRPLTLVIRKASTADAARIGAIARAAYAKYISRIGREPAPMLADFAAAIAADRVVVIETGGVVDGYMVAWPEVDAYFIDNIAVDPARQGEGLGRRLIDHAVGEASRLRLPAVRLYTNVAMSENLSMYAHLGFAETHRAVEHGFDRAYLRLTVIDGQ